MSRRDLARGSAALSALVGIGATARASAISPDAELLGLCQQFSEIQATVEPLLVQFFATPVEAHDELERLASLEGSLWNRQDALANRARILRARTQEGFAAKAGVARGLFLRQHRPEVEDGSLTEEMTMVWSLLNDLVGRA